MDPRKGIAKGQKSRRYRVVINWWHSHKDVIPEDHIKALENNARRRIETQIAKGETIGNLEAKRNGEKYEALWFKKEF